MFLITLSLPFNHDFPSHAVKAGSFATAVIDLNAGGTTNKVNAQAASSLENLKVKDSPVKKLDFTLENKENMPAVSESPATSDLEVMKKPVEDAKATSAATLVAKTIKELEAEEPILRENPHRFVLFPLQYHGSSLNVGVGSRPCV